MTLKAYIRMFLFFNRLQYVAVFESSLPIQESPASLLALLLLPDSLIASLTSSASRPHEALWLTSWAGKIARHTIPSAENAPIERKIHRRCGYMLYATAAAMAA